MSVAEKIGMRSELGHDPFGNGPSLKDNEHLEQAEKIFSEIGADFDLAETRKLLQAYSG